VGYGGQLLLGKHLPVLVFDTHALCSARIANCFPSVVLALASPSVDVSSLVFWWKLLFAAASFCAAFADGTVRAANSTCLELIKQFELSRP